MNKKFNGKMAFLVIALAFSVVLFLRGESWAPGYCGDGILWSGDPLFEQCDPGGPGIPGVACEDPSEICKPDCTCTPPPCGNGVLDEGEACDPGVPGVDCEDSSAVCEADCTCTPPEEVCGDGVINQDGEQCEVGIPCADPAYTCDVGTCLCSPPPGDEGCTPGFWKQEQHFGCWTGYIPEQSFSSAFGRDITILWSVTGKPKPVQNPTLLQALQANGGGDNRLARHGVAALLNAATPGVDFPLTVADVIAAVLAGDADTLADANELGCPLSQCNMDLADLSTAASSGPIALCGTTASVPVGSRGINLAMLGLVIGAVLVGKKANRS